ncbi:MAG: ornithine carbamoyltransferase [Chloroflexi bacterium]|nr:ornithine carbamoyltransferase [Chloroflexota bacterium]
MKHFLAIADLTPDELNHLLDLAAKLKKERAAGGNQPLLKGKVLGMVFQKPSLRTRVSFDMAMRHLGGDAIYLSPDEIGLGGRESVADVARVLSGYVDAIMARVFDHAHILELAKYSRVPVINGLSDYNHPCQALADVLTIKEHCGELRGLKVAYVGDGNNVATSLAHLCMKLGMDFTIATPEDYRLPGPVVVLAHQIAAESGRDVSVERLPSERTLVECPPAARLHETNDPFEAVESAHVVYTDTWTSMGQEAEAEKRKQVFPPYQVNEALLAHARPDCIVMHCLPAHRGQEITDEVMDGEHSVVFEQAENRMHAQKAILVELLATPPRIAN